MRVVACTRNHAATIGASIADFLARLPCRPNTVHARSAKRRIFTKLAFLPSIKALEQFDFGFASILRTSRYKSWPVSH
ncbi:hypothetical protein GCM10027081_03670 [Cupriavidus yeoncheonensis]